MKQKIFFLLTGILLLSMTIVSCSKDDELDDNNIVGTWTLVERGGGFSGTTIDIEAGTVVVTFTKNGEMTVYDKTDKLYFITSGTYDYYFTDIASSIFTGEPANVLVLKTKEGAVFSHFFYSLQDNTLRLSQEAFDGFNYIFKKMK